MTAGTESSARFTCCSLQCNVMSNGVFAPQWHCGWHEGSVLVVAMMEMYRVQVELEMCMLSRE